jgi:hypothetical protein
LVGPFEQWVKLREPTYLYGISDITILRKVCLSILIVIAINFFCVFKNEATDLTIKMDYCRIVAKLPGNFPCRTVSFMTKNDRRVPF